MMTIAEVIVRDERADDVAAIRDVNRRAFAQDEEGSIVEALRTNGASMLSLVATIDGLVVGHIMFSPASIGQIAGAALGPMAVVPEHQRHGIGSRLVETGVRRLAGSGVPFIIVVGHPEYYPRFGFAPASTRGIRCEWDLPENVFMIAILDGTKMEGVTGMAKYRPEFAA